MKFVSAENKNSRDFVIKTLQFSSIQPDSLTSSRR